MQGLCGEKGWGCGPVQGVKSVCGRACCRRHRSGSESQSPGEVGERATCVCPPRAAGPHPVWGRRCHRISNGSCRCGRGSGDAPLGCVCSGDCWERNGFERGEKWCCARLGGGCCVRVGCDHLGCGLCLYVTKVTPRAGAEGPKEGLKGSQRRQGGQRRDRASEAANDQDDRGQSCGPLGSISRAARRLGTRDA